MRENLDMELHIFTHESDRVTPALDHALRDLLYRQGTHPDPKDWVLSVVLDRETGFWSGSMTCQGSAESSVPLPKGFLHPMLPLSALVGVYGQGNVGVRFGTLDEVTAFRSGLAQSAYFGYG